jgi:hypothetical protein
MLPSAQAIHQDGGGCTSSVHSARGDNSVQGGRLVQGQATSQEEGGCSFSARGDNSAHVMSPSFLGARGFSSEE